MSVVDKSQELIKYFNRNMDKLKKMWDEIEMKEDMRLERTTTFYETMKDVIDFMVNEETTNYNEVFEDSRKFWDEVHTTRVALGLEKFDIGCLRPNTIAYCKTLKKEIEHLAEEKEKLIQKQMDTFEEVEALCQRLSLSAPCQEQKGVLLDPKKWMELQEERSRLVELLEKRRTEFLNARADIMKLKGYMKKLCSSRESTMLNVDVDGEDFVYSEDFLDEVKFLLEETQAEYDEWKQQRASAYNDAILQLRSLYDKCSVPELNRLFPDDFIPDFVDDSSMDKIQDEIAEYDSRYQRFKELYDAYYNWSAAWNDHVQVEADLADPNVYKNRAGHIQQVLTRQKDAEKRLKLYIKKLEALNDPSIQIYGMSLYERALQIIDDDKKQKELERQLKLEQKKENLKMEALYGTKSPRSLRKPQRHGTTFARQSLFDDTAISAIIPVKGLGSEVRVFGPKTSSPKHLTGADRTPLRRDPFKTPKRPNTKTPTKTPIKRN
uniref:Protein regulator of cytokinesis 1 n=1 Tax=Strongyloides papillosus TaxID=174720 RepID=A0A0N5BFR0_STREA